MLKKSSPGLLAALILFVPFLWPAFIWGADYSVYGNRYTRVTIRHITVKAEVVKSPEKLFLGLSHRRELPEGRGMFFVMPSEEYQQFCMRGMRFSLDLIWIAQGRVVGIDRNIAPENQRTFTSPAPVRYVLEVPGGFCEKHGLLVNDPVKFTL
ncbi:MAG: hypothetical protein A2Y80_05785 [Deltaproteobacteria bacterium RBG_13_58_19]|nr:MAG: hypothetical protein A2Y80_05785 [Deltaproteobacteria bacterium RBG_13_58_19]